MRIRISLKSEEWKKLLACLQQAYARGRLRLVKRIHALIYILTDKAVEEVSQILDLSESAVSHQLRRLREMALVKRRREGQILYYALDDTHVSGLLDLGLEHIRE